MKHEKLQKNLERIFGKEVKDWSDAKIRNQLETYVDKSVKLTLYGKTESIRNRARTIFLDIKHIDNNFTEYYINNLNNNKKKIKE